MGEEGGGGGPFKFHRTGDKSVKRVGIVKQIGRGVPARRGDILSPGPKCQGETAGAQPFRP